MSSSGIERRKKASSRIPESKLKVWKVESEDEDNDFDCYNKNDGKPVHVDVDKEITKTDKKTWALASLPNKSDQDGIINGEMGSGII